MKPLMNQRVLRAYEKGEGCGNCCGCKFTDVILVRRANLCLFLLAGSALGVLISLVVVRHYGILVGLLASFVVLALVIALSVGTANSDVTKD